MESPSVLASSATPLFNATNMLFVIAICLPLSRPRIAPSTQHIYMRVYSASRKNPITIHKKTTAPPTGEAVVFL
jgi:hypothetical protein